MIARLAINGFGRIGRAVVRCVVQSHPDIEIVGINSLDASPESCARALRNDSVFGRFPGRVAHADGILVVNGHSIVITAEDDPARCPWRSLEPDVVVEATGRFTARDDAAAHIAAGAARVIVPANGAGHDATIVYGVNENLYDPARHRVLSSGSSTVNCLAVVLSVLASRFGVAAALATSFHALTRDQEMLDSTSDDGRRGRSGMLNMVPLSTSAPQVIGDVLPALAGRVEGVSLRVPLPDVSMLDLTVELERPATAGQINATFADAASGRLHGVLGTSDLPLVSSDFRGDTRSAVIDTECTTQGPGRHAKVIAWYDNETACAARVLDLCRFVVGARFSQRYLAAPGGGATAGAPRHGGRPNGPGGAGSDDPQEAGAPRRDAAGGGV